MRNDVSWTDECVFQFLPKIHRCQISNVFITVHPYIRTPTWPYQLYFKSNDVSNATVRMRVLRAASMGMQIDTVLGS